MSAFLESEDQRSVVKLLKKTTAISRLMFFSRETEGQSKNTM